MSNNTGNLSFISFFFEAFYYEILRQKERILSNKWRQQEHDTNKPLKNHPQTDPSVEAILMCFQSLLEAQSLKANEEGGAFGVACYREVQYIMVVLADEIFLNLPWDGHHYWENNLLEERIFQSHIAGERFFNHLEAFLQERHPLKKEIGMVYLLALGLGFRGKYRGFDDEGVIAGYREKLFAFIYSHSPSLFKNKEDLTPQALQYTLEGGPQHELDDFRKWNLIFLSVFLMYISLSYTLWYGTTYQLDHLAAQVLENLKRLR